MQYLLTEFRDRLLSALSQGNHDAEAVVEQIFVHNPRTALSSSAGLALDGGGNWMGVRTRPGLTPVAAGHRLVERRIASSAGNDWLT